MKCSAGLKGRPSSKDLRSMTYQCDKLHIDATNPGDAYILAAVYRALFREDNATTRSIVRLAKKLQRAEAAQAAGGGDDA